MVKTNRFKFTLARLKALKPKDKRYSVYDTEQPGLRLVVHPTGGKVYEVVKKPAGSKRPVTVRICRAGELPLDGKDGIRTKVLNVLADMLAGHNPNTLKKREALQADSKAFTLRQAIERYTRIADIRPATKRGYKSAIDNHLADWKDLPLKDITPAMVTERHALIAKKAPVAANNTMRVLRVLFNHFREEFEDADGNSPIPPSPTRKLKKKWKRETRRKTYIKPGDMPAWWKTTEAITYTRKGVKRDDVPVYPGDGTLARDYLQFILLTGLRRREAAGLLWSDVDFKGKCFTVRDTKNHDDLELPLSDYLLELLERRYTSDDRDAMRVFPLVETKKFVGWVRDKSGVHFTVHDLRRNFISAANSLDLGAFTLKRLVNHRVSSSSDVTEGYVVDIDTERLRDPMQRITDYFLSAAGVRNSVVDLEGVSHGE